MAKDDLTGNMATENLILFYGKHHVAHHLNMQSFSEALTYSEQSVFLS